MATEKPRATRHKRLIQLLIIMEKMKIFLKSVGKFVQKTI